MLITTIVLVVEVVRDELYFATDMIYQIEVIV